MKPVIAIILIFVAFAGGFVLADFKNKKTAQDYKTPKQGGLFKYNPADDIE